jgi:hypothetical protein
LEEVRMRRQGRYQYRTQPAASITQLLIIFIMAAAAIFIVSYFVNSPVKSQRISVQAG